MECYAGRERMLQALGEGCEICQRYARGKYVERISLVFVVHGRGETCGVDVVEHDLEEKVLRCRTADTVACVV